MSSEPITLYTIGHSNHSLAGFVALLYGRAVAQVVDVRSHPYSRWVPHFRKRLLAEGLADAGIGYVFLGDALGGRPQGERFYRTDGSVDYTLRAEAADFQAGIDELLALAAVRTTAILCAEEDPARCHRRLLISPALRVRGLEVAHLRGDGRLLRDRAGQAPDGQLGLFS